MLTLFQNRRLFLLHDARNKVKPVVKVYIYIYSFPFRNADFNIIMCFLIYVTLLYIVGEARFFFGG